VIRARGLSWRYAGRPAPALHDIDIDVAEGEWLLVAGPSGSGKSTLALAIAGLVPHEFAGTWGGELDVDELSVPRTPRAILAAAAGLLFQEPAAQLVMEIVEDDVAFGLENRGWPTARMRERVREALSVLGIAHLPRRLTAGLSGGEQQRVALAGVLAPRPRILVLDEPTSNLDPAGTSAFYGVLETLRAADDRPTVVLIEHRTDLAEPLVDTVLALDATGGPIASGSPARVFDEHLPALRTAGIWVPGEAQRRIERAITAHASSSSATDLDPDVALELRDVTYRYDAAAPAALDGVSLEVARGERVALLGSNGSGKSTLGRLAAGLLRARSGSVRLEGVEPARLPAHDLAARATFVFQDPALQFLRDRVGEELHVGLRTPGEHAAADALLAELDLDQPGLRDASPYTLSGGQQRRLSVASALVRRPGLLVLDEPTYGQDRLHYDTLVRLLRTHVAHGSALLAATHDLVFAAEMTARAVVLERGRFASDVPTATLLHSPTGRPT
jgi:energy-coupling factor transport system ATP-binding protein